MLAFQKPLVSIITPTYNHERFIGRCIESVLEQTYASWEMLVADDGSTDGTGAVVATFRDSRIKYLRSENRGIWRLKETYNLALSHARGELVAVLEGDDFWPKGRLEAQVPLFEDDRVVLCHGRAIKVDELGSALGRVDDTPGKPAVLQERRLLLEGFLARGFTIMPVTVLTRRRALERIGGFQQPACYPAVDHPTWLHLATLGPFSYLDAPLGYWRRHRNQATAKLYVEILDGCSQYNIDFFDALSEDLRNGLRVTRKDVCRYRVRALAAAHFTRGRHLLSKGESRDAGAEFQAAFRRGDLRTRLKALVGVLCMWTGWDLESVGCALRRERYQ